jgi:hypothetical protein
MKGNDWRKHDVTHILHSKCGKYLFEVFLDIINNVELCSNAEESQGFTLEYHFGVLPNTIDSGEFPMIPFVRGSTSGSHEYLTLLSRRAV